jgi:hypothetical protein
MKIICFEDIEAWQEARKLVKMVYSVIKKSKEFRKDFRLVNQVQDAAVSSMSNIPEGFARPRVIGSLSNSSIFLRAQPLKFKVNFT